MQAMQKQVLAAILAVAAMGGAAHADVATEVSTLGASTITLHLHDFLTPADLDILRLVATDKNALKLFVPDSAGFAALAASPKDGFIVGGAPAASAVALGGLPDAATAATEVVTACQLATKAAAECVILLEVAPAK